MKNLQSSMTYSDYKGIIRAKPRVTGEETLITKLNQHAEGLLLGWRNMAS